MRRRAPEKVKFVNLERGLPSAASAVNALVDAIGTGRRVGTKALIVIHGYGSSGTGGAIKEAVRKKLAGPSLRGMITAYAGGESWVDSSRAFFEKCPNLREFSREISGNPGITVILL